VIRRDHGLTQGEHTDPAARRAYFEPDLRAFILEKTAQMESNIWGGRLP